MEIEIATWHFVVAAIGFAVLGLAGHIIRAVFNLFPDKISDTAAVNIFVSDGYSWADHIFGTQYDDAGYYKLDSAKNLKLSVFFTVAGGIGMMMFIPGAAETVAQLIETSFGFLIDLFWQRIDEVRGFDTALANGLVPRA